MKVLVTGATGFVGGAVTEALLRRGDEVRVLVRGNKQFPSSSVEVARGDLTDPESLFRACEGVDSVVHSAAFLSEFGRREEFWEANVSATEHLVTAARLTGASSFVYISSPSALQDPHAGDQFGIDESVPYPAHYFNLYSETKAAGEKVVLAAHSDDMRTCALRPRAVWGPGDRHGPLLRMLAKINAGRLPDLSKTPPAMFSLCYISHIADACVAATVAEKAAGKAYFICDDEPVDLWKIIKELATTFGLEPPSRRISPTLLRGAVSAIEMVWKIPAIARWRQPPLSHYMLSNLTCSTVYDTSAARRDLAFTPEVDWNIGSSRFIDWIETNGGLPKILEDLRE